MLKEIKWAFSENKKAIAAATFILFVSLVLGYLLEPYLYSIFNPVVDDLNQKVETGVITLTFQSIFFNNIRIVFTMFIFGMILCFSAVILAFNGFFTGYYIATTDDMLKTMLLIIPHGIFEFSSCILACASGFVMFHFLFKFLKALMNVETDSIKEMLVFSFNMSQDKLKQALILLAVASVLMAVAGFVEAYLTLPIAQFLLSF